MGSPVPLSWAHPPELRLGPTGPGPHLSKPLTQILNISVYLRPVIAQGRAPELRSCSGLEDDNRTGSPPIGRAQS